MKKADPADPRETAVLAALDRALDLGHAEERDPDLREIGELALALREEAPAPPPALVARLDRSVAEGFAREGRRRAGGRARRLPRLLSPPVLAGAGSVLVVVAVSVTVLSAPPDFGGPNALTSDPSSRTEEAVPPRTDEEGLEESAPQSSPFAAPRSVSPPVSEPFAPERPQRRVERSGSLTLAVPDDRLEAVGDSIVRVVDRRRGLVLTSSVSAGGDSTGGGTFDLRVPVDALSETMRELSALGEVRVRAQTSDDVTAGFASTADRLREYRAERGGLLGRLERADSASEAQAIRRRLRSVNRAIDRATRELAATRDRTDYARVSVSLVSEDARSEPQSSTGQALDDLGDSLVGAFDLALRALGVLIPLAVLLVPAILGLRLYRRRARESALRR